MFYAPRASAHIKGDAGAQKHTRHLPEQAPSLEGQLYRYGIARRLSRGGRRRALSYPWALRLSLRAARGQCMALRLESFRRRPSVFRTMRVLAPCASVSCVVSSRGLGPDSTTAASSGARGARGEARSLSLSRSLSCALSLSLWLSGSLALWLSRSLALC